MDKFDFRLVRYGVVNKGPHNPWGVILKCISIPGILDIIDKKFVKNHPEK